MRNYAPHEKFLPRYWPSWLLIGLLRLFAWLPYRAAMVLGRGLGRVALPLAGRRAQIARTNLALCFPEKNAAERERLLRDHFRALGEGMMEIGMAWWWPTDKLQRRMISVEGLEHLPSTNSGQSAILLTAHFTSLELSARIMGSLCNSSPMYRKNENPVIQWAFETYRGRFGKSLIDRDDLRGMKRALTSGQIIWFAPDQNFAKKGSVFADFMGVPAATTTATSRYAKWGQAQVVPMFFWRGDNGYHLKLAAPLSDFPSGDEQSDTDRINAFFSDCVRQAPEQYNWIHRRFKTQPDDAVALYPPKRRR